MSFPYCSIWKELERTIYYFLTALYIENYSAEYIVFLLRYMYRIRVHNILYLYCGIYTELQYTIYFLTSVYVQKYSVQYYIVLLQYIYRITVNNILYSYCRICAELQCKLYYFLRASWVMNYSWNFVTFLLLYIYT
jgi:hypothetical protein